MGQPLMGQPRGPPGQQGIVQQQGPPSAQPRGPSMGQPRGPPSMGQPGGPPMMNQGPQSMGQPQMQPRGPPTMGQQQGPTMGQPRGPPTMGQSQGPPPSGQYGQGPSPPGQYGQGPSPSGHYGQQAAPTGQYGQQQGASQGGYQSQEPQTAVLSDAAISAQCDPKYMRMSVNSIPHSQDHAQKCHLTMGIVISPMAQDAEEEIPVVNFGSMGVIRCKRCRTYINPFVQWVDNGRRWRCNICGTGNDVPGSYFCQLGPDQIRQDLKDRPELRSGSVEIVAPSEYMMRPPQPPVYVFVMDVSANSVQSGMLQVCVETIRAQLDDLPGAPRTRVAFISYDTSVHFYNLKSTLKLPQIMVVPDISELFIPIPDDLLVNLSESRDIIEMLLDMLPTMHQNSISLETALGPAVRAAFRVMAPIGGKMLVFQSVLPTTGAGALKHRENPRVFGTEKETELLSSVDTFYRQNAIEFSRQQVSVDMFIFSHQYVDLATLGTISKFSAGQLHYYPTFMEGRQREKFANELSHCLTREQGWEAVMRVRCSQGMRLSNFYGNSFMRGTDLLALPNVNEDSTFAIEMTHSDAMLSSSIVSVQAALLYTTSSGERRIRVHTMAAPVTKLYAEIFRSVDIDTLCNLMAKSALEQAVKSGLEKARGRLERQCVDIIRAFRTAGSYNSMMQNNQQLTLPDNLQLLPLYIMALMKNPVFKGGTDVLSDERTFLMYEMNNMPVQTSRVFIYPRLFSLHDMSTECGKPDATEEAQSDNSFAGENNVRLPPVLNLSVERLCSNGIFLLEDSRTLYLWIGRSTDPILLMALLGVSTLEGANIAALQLKTPSDDFGLRVSGILKAIREDRRPYMELKIMAEGDPAEAKLFWRLVEDRASFNGGSYSYQEYLGHVTRQSQGVGQ